MRPLSVSFCDEGFPELFEFSVGRAAVVPAFQFVAVLAALLFTGAAIYINLVEHPARMSFGPHTAATVFGPSYRRAAVMQSGLALVATAASVGVWLSGGAFVWLVGAVLIFMVIPVTLLVIAPTNKRLLDPTLDRESTSARKLLRTWGWLHAVRSVLGLLASLMFLSALIWP